jgi:hypothetical protein
VTTWRKSSRSGGNNGGGSNCVEVATIPEAILVRDSKEPGRPAAGGHPGHLVQIGGASLRG